MNGSWNSSIKWLEDWGRVMTASCRPVLGPTHRPVQWTPAAPSLGEKRPEREVDRVPSYSAQEKNKWTFLYPLVFGAWWLNTGAVS
jgi:hypothetical protein